MEPPAPPAPTSPAPAPLSLLDIARLEEARLAQVVTEIADESRPFLGGVMGRSTPGTWANYAVGFALSDGTAHLTAADLRTHVESLITFYEEKGIEPRLELCPFVHKQLLAVLSDLRFTIRLFEIVLVRDLALMAAPAQAVHPTPPNLRIHEVNKSDAKAVRDYATLAMSGFYPKGTPPTEDDLRLGIKATTNPRTTSLVATIDGQPVGAGSMETFNQSTSETKGASGLATLFGVTVLEPHRNKGIQQALIAHRLNLAKARNIRLATIGSLPDSPTERNVRRMGFGVAYVKPHLVRPGPGLARFTTESE